MTDPAPPPPPEPAGGLGSRPANAPDMFVPGPAPVKAPQPPPHPDWSPQPPRNAPLIAVGALLALLLVGVIITFVVVATGDDGAEPGGTTGGDPQATVPAVPEGERLRAEELYDADWDFKLGEIEQSADHVNSWDYPDCTGSTLHTAAADSLIAEGCQYRIEGAYVSADGHTHLAQQVLVFPDAAAADAASLTVTWEDFAFQPEGALDVPVLSGGRLDVNKQYMIVTLATIDTDEQDVADAANDLLHYFHTDHVTYFLWR